MKQNPYQIYDTLRILHNRGEATVEEVTSAYKNLPCYH
jgi:hypothetical protein